LSIKRPTATKYSVCFFKPKSFKNVQFCIIIIVNGDYGFQDITSQTTEHEDTRRPTDGFQVTASLLTVPIASVITCTNNWKFYTMSKIHVHLNTRHTSGCTLTRETFCSSTTYPIL
jgi:hypothetical protein